MLPIKNRLMGRQWITKLALIASLGLAISACAPQTPDMPVSTAGSSAPDQDQGSRPDAAATQSPTAFEQVSQQLILVHDPEQSGNIGSGGQVYHLEVAGDRSNNVTSQAFLTFELSDLPDGVTITQVRLDFSDSIVSGYPFRDLGCLRAFVDRFDEVDSADYVVSASDDYFLEICDAELLAEQHAADLGLVQIPMADDRALWQIRLQFEKTSDEDGIIDAIEIPNANLIIEFLPSR